MTLNNAGGRILTAITEMSIVVAIIYLDRMLSSFKYKWVALFSGQIFFMCVFTLKAIKRL